MDNTGYIGLTRQSGLMREMQAVANNIANMSTTGFRAEGVIFAEHVTALGRNEASISMAAAAAHVTDLAQAGLTQTGGAYDFAIEGPGFFQIETPGGIRLSRAGAFLPNAQGELVTPDGYRLLDAGGSPIFVPPGAGNVALSADGTLSAGGVPIALIGLVAPADPHDLIREDGVRFRTEGDVLPVEGASLMQGFLESSNVDPVGQITRMIEVQRAYEQGQSFLEREDDRIRSVLRLMAR